MASQKFQVQVWGFPEASLLDWPPDLQPIQTQKLGEELVFVHGSALPLFLRQAQHSPDRLPAAVFCKDRGTETPPDSWEWFDRVIEEGDWEGIRRILKCPRQVEIGEWVEEISGDQLEEITAAFTSEPPEISVLGNTPIPVEIKGHLGECEECCSVFIQTLHERLQWRYRSICPPVAKLGNFVRQCADPWVEVHLLHCSSCRAQVKALRHILVPEEVAIPIVQLAESLIEKLQEEMGQWVGQMAAIFNGCLQGQMQIGDGGLDIQSPPPRTAAPQDETGEMRVLLGEIKSQRPILLRHAQVEFILRWAEDSQVLFVEALKGPLRESIDKFVVQITGGGHTLWETQSQNGQVEIPAKVQRFFQSEAESLIIQIP